MRIAYLVCFAVLTYAQAPSPGNAQPVLSNPNPVTTEALYRFLFHHLSALDQAADQLDAQGKNGAGVRAYYQKALGLSDQELAVLKQNGVACLASIQQVDNAAQAIIRQIRSQNPGGKLPSRGALPPPDPRLTQLTQQRDDITTAQIASLQAALPPATFQRIAGS